MSSANPKKVLFVCTANRGRSPIAEAILKDILFNNKASEILSVESAGMCTHEIGRTGWPPSQAASRICQSHGLDISTHKARPVTPELVEAASTIIVMENWQKEVLSQAFPKYSGKVITLSELGGSGSQDMEDIAGRTDSEVEEFYRKAKDCLESSWRKIVA